jgi:Dna[CI] antecedent DciA-like protein
MDEGMESLRAPLAAGFVKRIEKELGEEVTLGLLWPMVVGSELARNTRLKAIRRGTLIVSAPDREWLQSLGSLETLDRMILDAAGRLGTGRKYDAVEFVVAPSTMAPREAAITPPQPSHDENAAWEAERALDTTMIGDESLRARFEASARKYFRTRSAAPPEHPRTK